MPNICGGDMGCYVGVGLFLLVGFLLTLGLILEYFDYE
jgi:hypothetical protein